MIRVRTAALAALALSTVLVSAQTAEPIKPAAIQGLAWRNIGPFRGGRVTTVAGVPSQPAVYYMGATGGGVWKTEDAGLSWTNVSDGFFKTGSVGAIAVAASDPNVVFVGMGEAPVRGVATSSGDGVYKSTDAGRTWTHVGLDSTRHISRIAIHPTNPDIVYVAAQGSPWAPTPDRGVYKTTDGGRTWTRIHHGENDSSGASDLAMDPTNPRILYVAYWDHQRTPWQIRSGGPGSAIYKTTDSGETWTKLADGLPKQMGKIGLAVSPPDPQRVWAIVEADEGGLYRSDDGGKTWHRTTDDRLTRARAWYYTAVTADPQNEDVVYVINAPLLKSIDAGRTVSVLAAPHGDNHQLWINPRDPKNMIACNDGGATITFNGGRSWSTQNNQPTAQFYRVAVDDRFPYYLYGGQQDNTTVAIPSRSLTGGIDRPDWYDVGGCESAHVAFDPKDPRLVYATCYQGILTEYDRRTKDQRLVSPAPMQGLAEPSNEQPYRFNWNAPVATSPHNRSVLYMGGNVLFRSENRGQTWKAISPDLTRNDKNRQGLGGVPITNEGAGGEVYGTIFYVVESPHEAGTIWVGTDDGLVQVTRDGGTTWTTVTPPGVEKSQINAIEVSPHDKATAYVAATGYKWNDFAPHVFRTNDYGRTWKAIDAGFRPNDFVRVVREDPVRRGLLYAGSETGAYVSFDDGSHWQSLQLNLPAVPVTDLAVHDDDLIAATQGRAFWILDDLTPLQQMSDEAAKADVHLFRPRPALRVDQPSNGPGTGQNPPKGASIDFELAAAPKDKEVVTLEILDASGRAIRSFSTEDRKDTPGQPPASRLTVKAGMNRFAWDLRTEGLVPVPGILPNGNMKGYLVAPGAYQVRLTARGRTLTQPFAVAPNPQFALTAADFAPQQELLAALTARIDEAARGAIRMRDARDQIEKIDGRVSDQKIKDLGKGLVEKIDAWEGQIVQPKRKTFQDVINYRNELIDQYMFVRDAVDGNGPPVTDALRARAGALDARWKALAATLASLDAEIERFNTTLKDSGIMPLQMRPRNVP
jgi:photosystem II stability/assembly factor-like uncharacterized protein